MAGGGIKGGITHGATDELGYEAVENPVHIHDWHATILHLLGLDHEKLTYRHAGRDFRLTDVKGRVIHDIIT
jgi:arylsulfatase A-like enzyme